MMRIFNNPWLVILGLVGLGLGTAAQQPQEPVRKSVLGYEIGPARFAIAKGDKGRADFYLDKCRQALDKYESHPFDNDTVLVPPTQEDLADYAQTQVAYRDRFGN